MTDRKAIVAAIDAGDDVALHALCDLCEAAGDPLARHLRRAVAEVDVRDVPLSIDWDLRWTVSLARLEERDPELMQLVRYARADHHGSTVVAWKSRARAYVAIAERLALEEAEAAG